MHKLIIAKKNSKHNTNKFFIILFPMTYFENEGAFHIVQYIVLHSKDCVQIFSNFFVK